METTMRGPTPGRSLSAGLTVICAVPEKKTLSGKPNTVPAMGTATVLGSRALEAGAKERKRIAGTSHRRVFMFALLLECALEDVVGGYEGHALRRRDWRRQRPHEWRSAI